MVGCLAISNDEKVLQLIEVGIGRADPVSFVGGVISVIEPFGDFGFCADPAHFILIMARNCIVEEVLDVWVVFGNVALACSCRRKLLAISNTCISIVALSS